MCGIIGIVSSEPVADRLVDGLRRMEYRGYDSSGICTLHLGQCDRNIVAPFASHAFDHGIAARKQGETGHGINKATAFAGSHPLPVCNQTGDGKGVILCDQSGAVFVQ